MDIADRAHAQEQLWASIQSSRTALMLTLGVHARSHHHLGAGYP
jgi:hypothetical protein